MTEDLAFNSLLLPILNELETHLDSLMVIGGWVPQLHRHACGATQWEVVPLLTTEVDVLLTGDAPSEGTTIAASLEDAGFTPVGDPATSAIWERDIKKGERIELFVHHEGTFAKSHTITTVGTNGEVNAIALPQLNVLRENSTVLSIDTPKGPDLPDTISVRVPELGIFAVHKGAIFFRRTDDARKIKDLHYIVDLMQSGQARVEEIEAQLGRYCIDGGSAASLSRTARNNVSLVLRDNSSTVANGLGEAVAERSGLDHDAGVARALGLLADFIDLIPLDCG